MNHAYRLVFNATLDAWVPAPEAAKGRGKGSKLKLASAALATAFTLATPAWALEANALPSGGQVVVGSGGIASAGNAMTVKQTSQNLAIDWQSFNIGANAAVRFVQPNSSAIALNRVIGGSKSEIYGKLDANGQVFLLNPNGVLFGKSAEVNVGGLVATTLSLSNADFMARNFRFTGTAGEVSNQGSLNGDYVALLGGQVSNAGTIVARLGTVALAAGSDIVLDFAGDGLIGVQVKQGALDALAENKGLIRADGGLVLMTAQAADRLIGAAVNNDGVIEARTVDNKNGRILLLGDMQSGEANVAGKLTAHFVETSAATVNLDAGLKVDTQGGEWLIDPVNITIDASKASAIQTALGSGNVTVSTADSAANAWGSNGTGTDAGDITVASSITWGAHILTLRADNNIAINATMTSTGATSSDGLVLHYAQTTGTGGYTVSAPVNLAAGSLFQTKQGSDAAITYTVITSLGTAGSMSANDLQGMNGDRAGKYVLGANIDASGTSGWNAGAGFAPIGDIGSGFTGTFDGLGHTITGLSIIRPSASYIGLFGWVDSGGAVRNIGLVGGDVTGNGAVGGLVGLNAYGTISNAYVTAFQVTGSDYDVGGLVGKNFGTISNAFCGSSDSSNFKVSGGDNVGGLVGKNFGTISNAYATSAAHFRVSGGNNVGGLVGMNEYSGTISNSYAAIHLDVGNNGGGLVGLNEYGGTISNSFYDWQVALRLDTGKGTSKTSAQMKDPFTFIDAGWDFAKVWGKSSTGENNGRMVLRNFSSTGYNDYVRLSGNTSKTYGDANPSLSGITLSGVGVGNVTPNWGSAIDTTTHAGSYAYSAANVLSVSTSSAGGVYVDYGSGALTVTPAALAVTANNASKTYGQTTTFAGTEFSSSGLVNGETIGSISLASTGAAATATVAGGPYAITASNASGGSFNAGDYSISFNNGALTVTPAALSVTANNAAKTYDGLAWSGGNGVVYSGFVNSENSGALGGSLSYGGSAQGAINANSYAITPAGLTSGNYSISFNNGALTVSPAAISAISGITAGNKTYDGTTVATLNASGASFAGMVGGDALTVGGGSGAFDNKNVGAGKTVNISGLTLGGADAGNYTLASTTGSASADIAARTVSLSGSRTLDGTVDLAASIFTLGNLVSGEALALTGVGTMADANVGSNKPVTPGSLTLGNGTSSLAANYTLTGGTHLVDITTQPPPIPTPTPTPTLPVIPAVSPQPNITPSDTLLAIAAGPSVVDVLGGGIRLPEGVGQE